MSPGPDLSSDPLGPATTQPNHSHITYSLTLALSRPARPKSAWRGPFVMTTEAEIAQVISEYRRGAFPPKRTPWDYKTLADSPADHPARRGGGAGGGGPPGKA